MSENTVISYNFLAALSETRKDLFNDVYVPFCKRALTLYCQKGNVQGTDQDVRELVLENFGLEIPVLMIRQLIRGVFDDLSRSDKRETCFKIFENGHTFQFSKMDFVEIEDIYKKAERDSNLLQNSFKDYLDEFGIQEEVPSLASFIDKNRIEITSFFAGNKIEKSDLDEKSYMIHIDFLEHIELQYHVLFKIAERLFLGSLIASFLESNIDLNENFAENIDYYIDTQLILRALDLQEEPETQPAQDLFNLIKQTGGKLKVFDHTIDELSQVLDYVLQSYNSEDPTTTINEACLRVGKTKSWLVSLNHNLESELKKKFGFKVAKIPFSFEKEIQESEDLKELKKIRSNKSNAFHDIICYQRVRYLRGGQIRSPKKANSWFVTPNKRLYKFNQKISSDFGIGEIVIPEPLTALLWLQDVNRLEDAVKKTGLSELISQTISEEIASRDLIISFENNLKAAPNVTVKQYKELLSLVARESAKNITKLNNLLESEDYETFENEAAEHIDFDRSKRKRYRSKYRDLLTDRNLKDSQLAESEQLRISAEREKRLQLNRAEIAENELEGVRLNNKIKKWRRPVKYFAIPTLLILVVSIFFLFSFTDLQLNYINNLVVKIDAVQSETKKFIFQTLFYSILFCSPITLIWMIYHYYFDESVINKAKENFKRALNSD